MRLSLVLLFFAILPSLVIAADSFDVRFESVQDRVSPLHGATFRAYVTNNQRSTDSFDFEYFDIHWRVEADPRRQAQRVP